MSDRALPGVHEKPRPSGAQKYALFVVLGVVVALIIGGIVASSIGGTYDPNNAAEAISQCEARIERELKSPATADFNSTASGSGTWTVTGTVDAENGFGATVRAKYQCTVVVNDDDTLTTKIDYINQ